MNILVTGGADFIGSHIAEHFSSEGHDVTILDNLATGHLHNVPKNDNVTFIEGDICDLATVAEAVRGIDYVFHHAAAIPIFLSRARAGKDIVIYGDGGQTRDFVHVSDVVRANVAAMDHGDSEVFNVATGASVTILELAENIVEVAGKGTGIVHEAERVGDMRDSRADVGKVAEWWSSEVRLEDGMRDMNNNL